MYKSNLYIQYKSCGILVDGKLEYVHTGHFVYERRTPDRRNKAKYQVEISYFSRIPTFQTFVTKRVVSISKTSTYVLFYYYKMGISYKMSRLLQNGYFLQNRSCFTKCFI